MIRRKFYYKQLKRKLDTKTALTFFVKGMFAIALAEITFALVFFLLSTPAIERAIALATTTKPETYTELYFENHTALPHLIKPNQKYFFKFTIHNLENADVNYPYEVYLLTSNGKLFIDQGRVTLKNNDFRTITEGFNIPDSFLKDEVVVNVINKNQQIGFWIEGVDEKTR